MSARSYILGQVVARGGMAEVYRGLHVGQDGFKRQVAIKRILPHHAQNAEFTEMFKDEAHIGQRLQHANIVKVEGFDIIEGSASIIMEFVDGSDLRSLLSATEQFKMPNGHQRQMPIELCIFIIAEAARGLHYAHTRKDDMTGKPLNIVHRDISPQNILISWDGEVKVTDFGIAAADRDFKQTETKAGIVKGKYSYMSPEQISGKKCDPRTDVFALTVVLWEMLAMKRLFTADNEIDVIEMVRNCRLPYRLREKNPNVTEELENIVLHGLAKDPRKRFDSMDSLEKALRTYLAKNSCVVTGQELGDFSKEILAARREVAQEEMRKMLTSTYQPSASFSSPSPTSSRLREISVEEPSASNTSTLTVGKARVMGAKSQMPLSVAPTSTLRQNPSQSSAGRQQNNSNLARGSSVQNQSNYRSNQQNTPSYLWVAAFIAIAIGGALFFKSYKNAAKQALTITMRTSPQNVRIKVNEKEQNGGKYITTPSGVKLDPGLNSIEVSRPGYKTETLLINTSDGMPKAPTSVRLKPTAVFTNFRIDYKGQETVNISINDGYIRQSLSPQKNYFAIPDLIAGIPTEISILSNQKKVLFKCAITPPNSTEKHPFILTIDMAANKCFAPSSSDKGGRP